MKNVNFSPWVGKDYFTKGYKGKRVLVLGESHYCNEQLEGGKCYPICAKEKMREDCFSQTEDVISDFVFYYSGSRYEQTFLCFERAVLGKELTQKEREDFWQSIVFYNYLQFCQEGPRKPVKQEYWNNSELAFKEILEEYLPDYIIVWGNRLYDGLPDWNGEHAVLTVSENDSTDIWIYTIKGKRIPAMRVVHPSTPIGKNWGYWHDYYEKLWLLKV